MKLPSTETRLQWASAIFRIHILPESLFTSPRNRYSHAPEYAAAGRGEERAKHPVLLVGPVEESSNVTSSRRQRRVIDQA